MKDADIEWMVKRIKSCVDEINDLILELHSKRVEISMVYKSGLMSPDVAPRLELLGAVEHVNYLDGDGKNE